ncbi:MAG TPA: DNA repair protein RecO, partial [Candidatus Saccharimonadia bacterium]|nr:DNA repair protein RecO [Candidatus Saccharimonadia bacterium]
MPTYQTTGIIIGRTNFGEADRIVRLFTPDHGKVSAVAKGVRRIKSRSGGHLELLGEVNLMLATGRNLDLVTSARLVWYPHDLATDYGRLELAFVMAAAIDRLTMPDHPQADLYKTFVEALHVVNTGASGALPELWFKLRLLNLTGYHPELSSCVVCSIHDPETEYFFSPERGGIVCAADANPTDRAMSHTQIKFWRLLSDNSYGGIVQIQNAPLLATQTLDSCNEFYKYHLGTSFREDKNP